jgi:hypothetical protein
MAAPEWALRFDVRTKMIDAAPAAGPLACPGCGTRMRSLVLERRTFGTLSVDLCETCRALWFDAFESVQLAPAATLELFRAIHDAARAERRPLPPSMRCPRCGETLQLTHDVQRTTHFSYHRCPYKHGRFTPFVQFLREKDFVRPLAADELGRLKRAVRSVRCSGCGAPIDLATMTACAYCHAPIELLDPDAVAKTLAELSAAPRAPSPVDIDALALRLAAAQRIDDARQPASGAAVYDLMSAGIDALVEMWTR